MRFIVTFCLCLFLANGSLLASTNFADAMTKDAAINKCRVTVGKPLVEACVKSGGGDVEACKTKATPQVRACVIEAMKSSS
jgi:hypothetical protein